MLNAAGLVVWDTGFNLEEQETSHRIPRKLLLLQFACTTCAKSPPTPNIQHYFHLLQMLKQL